MTMNRLEEHIEKLKDIIDDATDYTQFGIYDKKEVIDLMLDAKSIAKEYGLDVGIHNENLSKSLTIFKDCDQVAENELVFYKIKIMEFMCFVESLLLNIKINLYTVSEKLIC